MNTTSHRRRPRISPIPRRSAGTPISSRRRPLVLVVDDELSIRELLKLLLKKNAGCRVITAATCEQALQLAQEQEMDLLFSDRSGSPGRDGFQFLKAFKLAHPGVPVIFFSGTLTLARARRAYRLGAFLCLPKGGTIFDLLEAVRKALGARTESGQKTRPKRLDVRKSSRQPRRAGASSSS